MPIFHDLVERWLLFDDSYFKMTMMLSSYLILKLCLSHCHCCSIEQYKLEILKLCLSHCHCCSIDLYELELSSLGLQIILNLRPKHCHYSSQIMTHHLHGYNAQVVLNIAPLSFRQQAFLLGCLSQPPQSSLAIYQSNCRVC
jgi:hypothetical protein